MDRVKLLLVPRDRPDVADGRMATDTVMEVFDIGKEVAIWPLSCCIVTVMDELDFERIEEALHRGIVVAVALAAHRGPEAADWIIFRSPVEAY